MSKIELRLSDVEPPEPEPKRTIYRDIVNLPDPVKLGLTVRYFNHDDVALYFQITGEAAGYTFGTVNLGSLASGASAYANLDEFASRAKPSSAELTDGEMEETIKLILKAYTDSGYTNLKWTYERTVTVHWINSADPAFTVDVLNNFDDGTVQGWAAAAERNQATGYPTLAAATDYALSPPYSLKLRQASAGSGQTRARTYKSFTTPNKTAVFAILDIRQTGEVDVTRAALKNLKIQKDTNTLIYLGRPYKAGAVDFLPRDKWMRIVVPLPSNTTLELRIVQEWWASGYAEAADLWLDDFKLISK